MPRTKDTNTRIKVQCFCKNCNGLLVDPRTRDGHRSKRNKSYDYQEAGPSNNPGLYDDIEMDDNEMECDPLPEITDDPLPKIIEPLSERNYSFLTKKLPILELENFPKVKKGKISELVLENLFSDDENSDIDEDRHIEDLDDYDKDSDSEEDDEEVVNFASSDFSDDEPKLPNINTNNTDNWIILWILQYQQRYKLSNVAVDSLFNFLSLFLSTIDKNKFSSFPTSLYTAKRKLGIPTEIIQYAACNRCHKLYDINEILNKNEISTCSFVNYPNHSMEKF